MNPWYRVVDDHSPNKAYKVQHIKIYSGVKRLAYASITCVNGEIEVINVHAFHILRTVEDVQWVVENQEAIKEWIVFLDSLKAFAFETQEKLIHWLDQTPFFWNFDKKVHNFVRKNS